MSARQSFPSHLNCIILKRAKGNLLLKFSKWHGLGNDFILVDGRETVSDWPGLAPHLCDRHFGIGADGLVVLMDSDKADFRMRIFNPDGSEPEMCGNAIRCIARYVYENSLSSKTELTFDTLAGIIKPQLVLQDGKATTVRVNMGRPQLLRKDIPIKGNDEAKAINEPLEVAGNTYHFTGVSMGNPHAVIFVDDLAQTTINDIGPQIEVHPLFPRKTNVEFVQVLSSDTLRMKVWERGAGPTLACGTGTCATLVAAVLNNKSDRKAKVILDGGELLIEWDSKDYVWMTGPAVEVFKGDLVN